jgi:S1-C subfamily serine protease
MKRGVLLGVVLACVGFGHAWAAEGDKPILSVARITSSIPEGQKWGWMGPWGLFGCSAAARQVDLIWGSGAGRLNVRGLEQPAREELKKEGFAVAGDATDPFAEKGSGDFSVGATITSMNMGVCIHPNDSTRAMGSASMEIDWQVYSNTERRVVAKVHTSVDYKAAKLTPGGYEHIMFEAVDQSVQRLTSSAEFQQAVSQRLGSSRPARATRSSQSALLLAGAKAAGPTKIPEAVGAVVLVFSGGGHGSGFLVSSDGYLMTAEHVVGPDKYVKIRWSDGLEGVGEVIRADKRRDVALIKTDPRGRQPLALHRAAPEPGDTVFAIGTPLDTKFQSTVTRGVVSANRIMDGFSFIQSDVTISPGNSGGPLLDEKGEVLGICDLTFRPGGADVPSGINYFVPIDDALRFLAAEPQ